MSVSLCNSNHSIFKNLHMLEAVQVLKAIQINKLIKLDWNHLEREICLKLSIILMISKQILHRHRNLNNSLRQEDNYNSITVVF